MIPPPASRRLPVLVAVTGLAGGVVGAAYIEVLRLVTSLLGPDRWSPLAHAGLLVVVGAVVAAVVRWLGPTADVELLVDDIHVLGGPGEARGLRALIPASLLGVAVGGPLGPEAPLVTTTGVAGSALARWAGCSRRELRILTITGMAAGFTVLFGAPLGSAVFALEILHRRGLEYHEALLPSVVGALAGYGVATVAGVVGYRPMWTFPPMPDLSAVDLAWAVLGGALGAVVAIGFTHLTLGLRRAVGPVPVAARPVVGGILLALLALAGPYALTNGELQIDHLAEVRLTVLALVGAAVLKLVATSVALVSGWRGGFIIPLFFAGFCLGRAVGGGLPGAHDWVFVLGVMVAVNVGVTKTPLGSALVVSEMAGLAVLPSTLVAALVALVLTSDIGLIESQRRRLGVDEEGRAGEPADRAVAGGGAVGGVPASERPRRSPRGEARVPHRPPGGGSDR